MENKKIIIVGAGPGGLTAGMLLANKGYDVEIFEKEKKVGGRNAPIKSKGYTFDTGPTFLMMQHILKEVFEKANKNIEEYLDIRKLSTMYRLIYPDKEMEL